VGSNGEANRCPRASRSSRQELVLTCRRSTVGEKTRPPSDVDRTDWPAIRSQGVLGTEGVQAAVALLEKPSTHGEIRTRNPNRALAPSCQRFAGTHLLFQRKRPG